MTTLPDGDALSPYPFQETVDVRTGPDLHPALLGLLPYIGVWRGRGKGGYPAVEDFDYGQEVRFSHDGRPFLFYQSRAWLIEPDGTPIRPAHREVGFWRPVVKDDQRTEAVEVQLVAPNGIVESYVGRVDGLRVELITDKVLRSGTAKEVSEGHRLYGIVDRALLYAYEMAAVGQPRTAHLSAKLDRVGG